MNLSRRQFFGFLGTGASALALPGCIGPSCRGPVRAKTALQLYSLNRYIRGAYDKKTKKFDGNGVGFARAFDAVAAIGYKGVQFAGYNDANGKALSAKEIRKLLRDSGLKAAGCHIANSDYGFDMKNFVYNPDVLKKTCEFNLEYGNTFVCCPGGGNIPTGVKAGWQLRRGNDTTVTMTDTQADYVKRLAEFYNRAAADAAKFGCRIGIHNHTWEFGLLMPDGTTYWDYFFSHTDPIVCMEQDVGWTTCAGYDPCEQYVKYPHRAPTLHAKENGMGKSVKKFDAILGKPGIEADGTLVKGVDWEALLPVTERDGVEWYVVECEQHFEDLSAVAPSYEFLRRLGLN